MKIVKSMIINFIKYKFAIGIEKREYLIVIKIKNLRILFKMSLLIPSSWSTAIKKWL